MLLTAYASGSDGNAFDVCDGATRLLLECGLPFKKLQSAAGHNMAAFSGVLITHEHMDHAKAAAECARRGMEIYSSPGTLAALGLTGANIHPVQPYEWFRIGSLYVQPFNVHHDVAQPYGYLFYSVFTHERLVFATDTYKLPHIFPEATELAIECNYSAAKLLTADIPDSLRQRIKRNHMALESCKAFLQQSDLSQVQRIHLIHLSAERSDAERFRTEIAALTGKEVVVA